MEDIKLQIHIAKGELHDSILAIYDGIRCGQKWPPKYNGHMVSAFYHWFRIKNYEIYRIIKFAYFTKTSSTIPLGIFTNRSAKDRVMLVGFSSPKPNYLYTEYGRKLTLAPKSSSVLSIHFPPMLTEMVGGPGSLYFTMVLH